MPTLQCTPGRWILRSGEKGALYFTVVCEARRRGSFGNSVIGDCNMPDGSLNVPLPNRQGSALDVERPHLATPERTAVLANRRPDVLAGSVLLVLSVLLIWHRLWVWNGLAYLDVATFYMPWYAFLGQHLRELQIPAWNRHLFSGVPFAGDPQSGWMYFPAMFFFAVFNPLTAYKLFLIFHLLLAGASTYIFARVVGIGAFGSLAAAIAFEFGPLSSHIACCLINVQLGVWIPPALLGVELAARSSRWSARLGWWSMTALAVSQMMAGWVGQGAYNGALVTGAYILFRNLVWFPYTAPFRHRFKIAFIGGGVSLGLGVGIAAAGLLPRIDAVRETNVSGGEYSGTGINNYSGPWEFTMMLRRTFGDHNGSAGLLFYLGATTIALTLMAPFILRRRLGAPFFFGLTAITLLLSLRTTPIHLIFYLLLPKYKVLQEHVPSRILAVQWLGPAMVTGAVIDQLRRGWIPPNLRRIALIPMATWAVVMIGLYNYTDSISSTTVLIVVITCLIVTLFALVPDISRRWDFSAITLQHALSIALLFLVLWDPAGRVFVHAVFGIETDPVTRLPNGVATNAAIAANVSPSDPGGAGEFLQFATADGEAWRFFGYDDALQYGGAKWPSTYREWYYTPEAISLLINARAMPLGLDDAQGYNPVQLKGYVEFLNALNQGTQNYHDAQILPAGLMSPLLNLLNVRYIVIPNDLPAGRPRTDLIKVLATHKVVFQNSQIQVLENENALPRAWITHNVIRADRATQLTILAGSQIDPAKTAMIAGASAVPDVSNPPSGARDALRIIDQTTDGLTLNVDMASAGVVVISQSFANGWNASVDGKSSPLYLTDGILQGVPVPAGLHLITLKYEPRSLMVGLWTSGVSAALLAGIWVYWARDRRRLRAERALAPPSTPAL